MGIPGLTSFVDKTFIGWKLLKIEGVLVVDGSSLCHRLYESDWAHGGQYGEYRTAVREFFRAVLDSGIRPVVVFDGIDVAGAKMPVMLKRRKEWIEHIHSRLSSKPVEATGRILPLFAIEVLQQTVLELQIPLYVADGEADAVLVEVANFFHCPILSSDSDFFIFNVNDGYIPFNRFHWNSVPITAEVFFSRAFMEQFGLKHESLCYIIPAYAGNDFIHLIKSPQFFSYLCEATATDQSHHQRQLPVVVKFASLFKSLEDCLSKVPAAWSLQLTDNCARASKLYNVTRTLDPAEFMRETNLQFAGKSGVPHYFLQLYRLGKLPLSIMEAAVLQKCILRVAIDDCQRQSSLALSKPIREQMYTIVGCTTVVEMFRHGLEVTGEKALALPPDSFPSITKIPSLCAPDREQLLCRITACSVEVVHQVPSDWRLLVVAAKYWARVAVVPPRIVEALVLCLVSCASPWQSDLKRICRGRRAVCSKEFRESNKWMAVLHAFTQWQCVLFDVVTLNHLLMEPLKSTLLAYTYDGKMAMHIASSLDMGQKVREASIDRRLYDQLLHAVLYTPTSCSTAPSKVVQTQQDVKKDSEKVTEAKTKPKKTVSNPKTVTKPKTVSKPKMLPKPKTVSPYSHANRFALLEDLDSDISD